MPVDATAQVSVVARSSGAANFSVQARVTADNDRVTSNNNRQIAVTIRSGIDASLVLSTSASEVALGAPIEIYADVRSQRSLSVRNAVLSVNLNQAVTSASMPGGVCTTNASSVSCVIAEIPAGTTRRLTVRATTQVAGSLFAGANVNAWGMATSRTTMQPPRPGCRPSAMSRSPPERRRLRSGRRRRLRAALHGALARSAAHR